MRRTPRRGLEHPSAVEREPRQQVHSADHQVEPGEGKHDLAREPGVEAHPDRSEGASEHERRERPHHRHDELG